MIGKRSKQNQRSGQVDMVEGVSATEVCRQETPLCTSGRTLEGGLDGAVRFSLLEMGREFLIE